VENFFWKLGFLNDGKNLLLQRRLTDRLFCALDIPLLACTAIISKGFFLSGGLDAFGVGFSGNTATADATPEHAFVIELQHAFAEVASVPEYALGFLILRERNHGFVRSLFDFSVPCEISGIEDIVENPVKAGKAKNFSISY
jgi:hypothetical protein